MKCAARLRDFILARSSVALAAAAALLLGGVGLGWAEAKQDSELRRVTVRGVALHPESGAPVVMLIDEERGLGLPIWIGFAEAQAIALTMEQITPPRPLTHDLMSQILREVNLRVDRVVIDNLANDTFYATIFILNGATELKIDARPSDAIALALRSEAPVFVAYEVLQKAETFDISALDGKQRVEVASGLSVQTLTAELADYFQLEARAGVLVADVKAASPAERAGLRRGDVITKVGATEAHTVGQFVEALEELSPGGEVSVELFRNGETIVVTFAPGQ